MIPTLIVFWVYKSKSAYIPKKATYEFVSLKLKELLLAAWHLNKIQLTTPNPRDMALKSLAEAYRIRLGSLLQI